MGKYQISSVFFNCCLLLASIYKSVDLQTLLSSFSKHFLFLWFWWTQIWIAVSYVFSHWATRSHALLHLLARITSKRRNKHRLRCIADGNMKPLRKKNNAQKAAEAFWRLRFPSVSAEEAHSRTKHYRCRTIYTSEQNRWWQITSSELIFERCFNTLQFL